MSYKTADLSDSHLDAQIATPLFYDFGQRPDFFGRTVTVKVFEDNTMVRATLVEAGNGRVLVIDGGGSLQCALVGGNLAQLAVTNGWTGIVVNGCIRDSEEIGRLSIGVKALATHPRKSKKGTHLGARDCSVTFAGVTFRSGQWLYADLDGILISVASLHE
jgi:regulator of ribonuclease activity A